MIKSTGPKSEAFVKGVMRQASSIVEVTYGPRGGFVSITNGKESVMTKDGVTVIKSLSSPDIFENAILTTIKEAAQNTLSKAGDGTTTTIVLADKILTVFAPSDYMKKDEIIRSVKRNIRALSRNVSVDSDEIKTVALTSTAGDEDLAKAVVEAFSLAKETSINGIIAEGRLYASTHVSIVDGSSFSGNVIDLSFYDDKDSRSKDVENAHVVFSSSDVSGEDNMVEFITNCVDNDIKDVVIIAPSFAMSAMSTMIVNNGVSINITPIVIDGGDAVKTKLAIEAVSTYVGGYIIGEESGVDLQDCDTDSLVSIGKVSIKGNSILLSGVSSQDAQKVDSLIKRHESALREVGSDEERDVLKVLLSILHGKLVKVIVGGNTLASLVERKDRADDCINSIEMALLHGVVPGACAAYANMAMGIDCSTSFELATEELSNIIKKQGEISNSLDPTFVVEVVAEQAIELAFMLGMTRSVVAVS